MRRFVLTCLLAVLLALFLVWLVLFLNRGETSATAPAAFPAEPDGIAFVDEAVVEDDLGRMAATADLIVRGAAQSAAPGETHRYTDQEGLADETDRLLSVQVDEVLFSADGIRIPAAGSRIAVIEGWWSGGIGYHVEGMPWAKPGLPC